MNGLSALGSRLSAAAILFAAPLAAQATKQAPARLDRTKQPEAGPTAPLRVPTWTKTSLANGAELVVSVKRGLPLVSVTIDFIGGAFQFEDAAKLGTATLTAQMMSEGTTTRTGDQIADAQTMLGLSIFTSVGRESGSMSFTGLADKLDGALDLAADIMVNPSFPADALTRRRGQMLVSLTQGRDQPNTVASNVFSKVLYGDDHPYGRVATEATVNAVTRDDIVAFHQAFFRPGRAVITVVGDVDAARVKASVERAFAKWTSGGARPTFSYPPVPASRERTIYLVDKPRAAQSVFALGVPGPERNTPDYYAISVMNTILGGLFQSRLNHLIREVRGYSYGVNSSFAFGKGPGAVRAGGGIITAKTDSAMIDFMNELKGVQGGKPFTADEIIQGKETLIQRLPDRFGSVNGVSGAIAAIYTTPLPETYYQEYAAKINAITADDLVRVAKKYIDWEHFNLVIVGDKAVIEEPLRKLNLGPIVYLDVDGKRIATPVTP